MESLFRAISIEAFGVWAVVLIIFVVIIRYLTKKLDEKEKIINEFLTKFVEAEKQNAVLLTSFKDALKSISSTVSEQTRMTEKQTDELKEEVLKDLRDMTNKLQAIDYNIQTIREVVNELVKK